MNFKSIPDYISKFPIEVQEILQKIYSTIKKAVPEAEESISYQMPAFKFKKKPLIYFAAWKTHIGLYATPSANEAFKKDLAKYQQSKGSIKFMLDEPIPYDLIEKMAVYKKQEILNKSKG